MFHQIVVAPEFFGAIFVFQNHSGRETQNMPSIFCLENNVPHFPLSYVSGIYKMAKQFTLGKQERLKSRKLIDELFSKGERMNQFPFRVFYMFQQKENPAVRNSLQCGVGVSTRNFKKAVDRNRIKRLAREAYRLQKTALDAKMKLHPKNLSLFLIFTGKELPEFTIVKEKIALILQKLITIAHENAVADT